MRERFERQKQASIRALATLSHYTEFTFEKCVNRAFATYSNDVTASEQSPLAIFAAGYRCGLGNPNVADGADVLFHAELIVNVMREALYMHQVHQTERFEDCFFDLAGLNLAIKFACLDVDEFEAAVTLLCDLKLVRIHSGTLRFVEANDATNEKLKESLASRLTDTANKLDGEPIEKKHWLIDLIFLTMQTLGKKLQRACTRSELFVALPTHITDAEFQAAIEYLLNKGYIVENDGKLSLIKESHEAHV